MSHLKKLPLHGIHLQNNAIMSAYAGWTMPLYYRSAGIVESNLHTRKEASLFDVSHMYQTR